MPPARSPGLDILRAFAILAVMAYHLTIFGELPLHWLPVTWYGWMGVDLFFVLSGYLIGGQVLEPYAAGRRASISDFYRRRAWRILPTYAAVLALYVLVPAWREFPVLAPLWKFLTFTMNLDFSSDQRAFSQAWSLCVEEHFYLLLPLIIAALMRRPSARKAALSLIALLLGGIALRAWLITHHPGQVYTQIYYPSYTRLDGLTDGVALAASRAFRPRLWRRLMQRGHLLSVGGVACVVAVCWLFRGLDFAAVGPARWGIVLGLPLLACGFTFLTASAVSANGLLCRLHIPGAQTLAALAYCLYLTHKPVAHLILLHLPQGIAPRSAASWPLFALACPLAALLLHLLVERPGLRLRDRQTCRLPAALLEARMRQDPPL